MNVAQEIVAKLYVAAPEVSDPPELIGPVVGVAKPAGKSDSGSSTDSSCVPVSCPVAAGRAAVDGAGAADDGAVVPAVAAAVPGVAEAVTDGVVAAAEGVELLEDEHPATVTSTPAAAARAAKAGRAPDEATEDTALPTPDLDLDT